MLVLLAGAVIVRVLGATLRPRQGCRVAWVLGWVLSVTAAWMAVASAWTFSPIWLPIAVAAAGAVVDVFRKHKGLQVAADLLIVLLAGAFSWPVLAFWPLAAAALAIPTIGLLIDALVAGFARTPLRVVSIALGLPLATSLALGVWGVVRPTDFCGALRSTREILRGGQLAALGLTVPGRPERVVLASGSVAWLERPAGGAPDRGAVFFHGADPRGSFQPAAVIARRALLSAGYAVLSIDHPGFGESPAPVEESGLEGWDPGVVGEEGYAVLESMGMSGEIVAVGHSMGATEALRLLAGRRTLKGAVFFGASLHDVGQGSLSAYWYERFHSDRGLPFRLTPDEVTDVLREHYSDPKIMRQIGADHPAVTFVAFEKEHQDVAESRDLLYDLIPGRKELITLRQSSHYFNAHGGFGVVVGDARILRALEELFYRLGRSR